MGEGRDALQPLMKYGGLGLTLALGVAFFSWIGWLLDGWLGTAPVFLAVMCLLGAAVGLYKLIRDTNRWTAEEESEARKSSDASAGPDIH